MDKIFGKTAEKHIPEWKVSYITRVYNNFLKNCEEKSSQK